MVRGRLWPGSHSLTSLFIAVRSRTGVRAARRIELAAWRDRGAVTIGSASRASVVTWKESGRDGVF
jgi:hypothetical protein